MAQTKIPQVESVSLSLASSPGRIIVIASGTVPTSGWTEPELVDTCGAPADGNVHLDFVASKPAGIVLQVISPIGAKRFVQRGAGMTCFVIHAGNNEIRECIDVTIGDPI